MEGEKPVVSGKRGRGRPAKLRDKPEETPKPGPKAAKNTKLNMSKVADSGKKGGRRGAKNTEEVDESLENIEEVEKGKSSNKKVEAKQSSAAKKGGKKKEDWVTLIVGENGDKAGEGKKKEGKGEDSSVYDLEPEAEEFLMKGTPFFSKEKDGKSEKKPRNPRKQELAAKTTSVTKIGNNGPV